jgi:hypothetical protein
MRFLGLCLLLAGAYALAQPYLPTALRLESLVRFPALPLTPIGAVLGVLGLFLLLKPRRRRAGAGDDSIRDQLRRRGLTISSDVGGWRADGNWKGTEVVIRRTEGYEASRFGRPWVIELSLPGRPREPWPLTRDRATVVDVRDHGFSVTIPDLSLPGGYERLESRIDDVLASRSTG